MVCHSFFLAFDSKENKAKLGSDHFFLNSKESLLSKSWPWKLEIERGKGAIWFGLADRKQTFCCPFLLARCRFCNCKDYIIIALERCSNTPLLEVWIIREIFITASNADTLDYSKKREFEHHVAPPWGPHLVPAKALIGGSGQKRAQFIEARKWQIGVICT